MKKINILLLPFYLYSNNIDINQIEEKALNIKTPLEELINISEKYKNNPFILKALRSNPKFRNFKENNHIEYLYYKNKKKFNNEIKDIKKDINEFSQFLNRLEFIFKKNLKKENKIKKNIINELNNLKLNEKESLDTKLKILNAEYKSKMEIANKNIEKLNEKIKKLNNKFYKQLSDYILLEKKKKIYSYSDIETEDKILRQNTIESINYLKNIIKRLKTIKTNINYLEMNKTINKKLLSIIELFIKDIENMNKNIKKLLKIKIRLLFAIENNYLQRNKRLKKIKILKVNKDLLLEKNNKELQQRIDILKAEYELKNKKVIRKFLYNKHSLELELNEINYKINNNLKFYQKLSGDNRKIVMKLNEFKDKVDLLNKYKMLVKKEDEFIQKIGNDELSELYQKIEVAKNISTPLYILIKYSKSLEWKLREAVASNIITPLVILKDLQNDENIFVRMTANKTIEKIKKFNTIKKYLKNKKENEKYKIN